MEKGHLNNSIGDVTITADVIAQYAGAQALECFGIVGMAAKSKKDSVMHMLKKESLKKGINVTVSDNKISIDFHVIVAYGLNIVSVTENLMENVKYKLEEFTGMKVEQINVLVEGVRVID
ncbi:MAG: Asp23/Gls24 family envelope stress response protein [Lachnospiraceae bacterium]|nr:Asp23/Gls24 family envelope stress response protein [Candidatus Darwinimomas equi]